jgi:hypothetical protein
VVLVVTHWAIYYRCLLDFHVKDFTERYGVRAEIAKCGRCDSYRKIKAALRFVAIVDTRVWRYRRCRCRRRLLAAPLQMTVAFPV